MSKIRPSELGDRLADDDVFVLDVRPRENYQRRHITESYNAPVYGDLRRGDTAALDDHLGSIPQDADVVTVCKAGVVAKKATSHLQEQGYDAATLSGGFRGWRHYEDETLVYRIAATIRGLVS